PTCIVCRNWGSNFSMLGPRQLALSVEIGDPISLCWGPPQLALFVEFLFEILCVGAPRVLKKLVTCVFSFSQLLPIYH
ncbi:hypothetical protein AXE88_11390, partial [Staphylococcus aureus]|nr:hypothetical protein [Staphylococcus aureus]